MLIAASEDMKAYGVGIKKRKSMIGLTEWP